MDKSGNNASRILSDEIRDRFISHLTGCERGKVTVEKYSRDIARLRDFADGREITKELIVAYKQHLIDSGYAERSVNSMLAAVNSLFSFLEWYDCRVRAIKLSPEIYRPEEKELTKKEYDRIVNTAMEQGREQLAVILQTICGTGIRVSELRFITAEAVRRGEATVRCKGKTRKVFIVPALKRLLLDYIRKRHIRVGPVFLSKSGKPVNRTTIWREMKSLCKSARVNPSKVFPHNLRHLFARVFYKTEKDIAKLADILGHSSINTTRIYLMSTGTEHKRRMERLGLVIPMRL